MKTYLLFGIEGDDLHETRRRLEGALGIEMMLHESLYRGGDYYRSGDDEGEHLILQRNFNSIEDEWMEPNVRECGLLLYANQTDRPADIRTALEELATLVSSQEL